MLGYKNNLLFHNLFKLYKRKIEIQIIFYKFLNLSKETSN
jgi:hypothetical protein